MNTIVDILLELLEQDMQELIPQVLVNEIPEEELICKRFNAFIEYLSPSEKNLDN